MMALCNSSASISSYITVSALLLLLVHVSSAQQQAVPDYDCVIIGSGISGLSAASWLQKNGDFKVLVLEAQDRVGGRLKTVPLGDSGNVADLGASWIHGIGTKSRRNPIFELSADNGIETIVVPGDPTIFLPDGSELSKDKQSTMFSEAESWNEYFYDHQSSGTADLSISDLLERYFASEGDRITDEQQQLLRNYLNSMVGNEYAEDLSRLSSLNLDVEAEDWPGEEAIFPGGYQQVAEALASHSPVCLNQTAVSIDYSGDHVVINTSSGLSTTASCVIVTAPLGYLHEHTATLFTPPLPGSTVEALGSMSMGLLNKVVLMWDAAWWKDLLTTDWVIRMGYDTETFSEFYNLMATEAQLPIIIAFSFGDSGRELENLSDEDTVVLALQSLQTTLPEGTEIPAPVSSAITRWASDPWTYGSYSYVRVGKSSKARELQEPVDGKVFFAGEHTSVQFPSTVHGAYLSGKRAAEAVAAGFSPVEARLPVNESEQEVCGIYQESNVADAGDSGGPKRHQCRLALLLAVMLIVLVALLY